MQVRRNISRISVVTSNTKGDIICWGIREGCRQMNHENKSRKKLTTQKKDATKEIIKSSLFFLNLSFQKMKHVCKKIVSNFSAVLIICFGF